MKKISKVQYNSITFLLTITMFFGIGLSNIANSTKESFWISLIIGIILGLLIILGFSKIMEREKNSLIESANKKKSYFYIILSLVFIYIGISILTNLITSIYLTEINPILIAVPLIGLLFYGAFKGKVVVARIAVLITIFCIILAVSIIFNLIPEVEIKNYLPLFNTSIAKVLLQGFNFACYSTAPLLLLSLYSPNEVDNYKKTSLLTSYLVACILLIFMFFLTIGVMGVDLASLYRYPEYIVLKKVSYFRFINNIENFNAFFWILMYLLLIILSGTCLKESIEKITSKKWIFILIVLLIFLLIIFTTFRNINFILMLYKYQSYILGILILGFFIINFKKEK